MTPQKVAVVTDSSANIPQQIVDALGIHVMPLWLIWDEQKYLDGIDMTPQEFCQRLRGSKTLPTSSQPTALEFQNFFNQVAAECDAIVAILASSRISGTVASAEAAKAEMPGLPIEVVDSKFSSMGLGLISMVAARAAAEGSSIDEVAQVALEVRDRVRLLFVVDTLEYLHRGGRIGGAKRLLGTALRIKPILHFHEGQIEPLAQARTKKKALAELMNIIENWLPGDRMEEAAVVNVDCSEDGLQLLEQIKDRFQPDQIHLGDVSPVVSTHVGPGALGVAFYGVQQLA
jgi:DegV family protein with EDD domain